MGASNYVGCCSSHISPKLAATGIRQPEEVLKEVGKLKNNEFSEQLFKIAHDAIINTIDDVFGSELEYEHKQYELSNRIIRNSAKFAAFKAVHFSQALKNAKTQDEKDKLFRAFEIQLDTEVALASKAAQSAKQFERFKKTQATHPNLEYLPSRSADKREDHKDYYGTILPIDHPFWNTAMPPSDYGCKCRVRATAKTATQQPNIKPLPKGIVGNPFKEQKAFANNHNFFENVQKHKPVNDLLDTIMANHKYPKASYKSKAKVYVHHWHDTVDIKDNYQAAKLLADAGVAVKIRPHLRTHGVKNPEFEINGKFSDLKISSGKGFSSIVRSAAKQKCETFVIKMHPESPYNSAREIANKVNGTIMSGYTEFKGFWIIDKKLKVTYWEARKKAANK